jgi:hypothetical protein
MTGRPQTRRTPAGTPAPRFRPRLEVLEGRCLPSTLTVTTAADGGTGSLRYEINAAQAGDTIVFAPGLHGQTIGLTSGLLDLTKNLTIQGPGAGLLTVSGNNQSTVFKVEPGAQVTLSGLTIFDGNGGTTGGGILNSGTLTVSSCNIAQDVARSGGGIYNLGTLTVSGSTIRSDTASDYGGGIYNASGGKLTLSQDTLYHNVADLNGGGIYNASGATATLTNCTLNDNMAFGSVLGDVTAGGGGIYVNLDSTASLTNCTLSLNSARSGHGGGIDVKTGGILDLTNTIVAGNSAGHSGPDIYGAVTTADHNLVGNGAGSSGIANGGNGNIVGGNGNPVINADLGPLQNSGGPTPTMALLAGSPAIGHADNTQAPATDQRGVTRLDGAGETTDIGAFEL